MPDADLLLQKRFRGERPGFDLLGIEHAAVPVTVVNTDVLAQERKALPLLDEFFLRAVKASVGRPAEIAAFLGLDRTLVDITAADLLRSGMLAYGHLPGQLALTVRGQRAVDEHESIKPTQRKLAISFDRLTWSVADYERGHLLTKREAKAQGMLLLPARQTTRIVSADITPVALNSLLSQADRRGNSFEILDVLDVSPNTHRYMPVRLLVFSDQDRGEIQAAVSVDGDLSTEHELALVELGGPTRLNLHASESAGRPQLTPELEPLRTPVLGPREDLMNTPAPGGAEPRVRGVALFEHQELLTTALETARERILIISSHLTRSVVDPTFLNRLEQRVRARVRVHVIIPTRKASESSESAAMDALRTLERKHQGRLQILVPEKEMPNSLIFDQNWVVSDFPWLSFRGGHSRTYRNYEGTLVTVRADVDRAYGELLGRSGVAES